jgi:hypothetical protein
MGEANRRTMLFWLPVAITTMLLSGCETTGVGTNAVTGAPCLHWHTETSLETVSGNGGVPIYDQPVTHTICDEWGAPAGH